MTHPYTHELDHRAEQAETENEARRARVFLVDDLKRRIALRPEKEPPKTSRGREPDDGPRIIIRRRAMAMAI